MVSQIVTSMNEVVTAFGEANVSLSHITGSISEQTQGIDQAVEASKSCALRQQREQALSDLLTRFQIQSTGT